MATAVRSAATQIVHDNYTSPLIAATKTVSVKAVYITISNRATTPGDSIGVSFDGGTNFYTIDEGSSFSFDIWGAKNYKIKANVNPAITECVYGLES